MDISSPLFPAARLAPSPGAPASSPSASTLIPQLPDKPLVQTSSLQIFIVPAEKHLFVQGFEPHEYENRPPTLLRGCLVVRVLKHTKLKSISLNFRGTQRTEWPEGIPPKKSQHQETNVVVNHTWPFLQSGSPVGAHNGADFYRETNGTTHRGESLVRPSSRAGSPSANHADSPFSFTRSLSPAFMRRTTSPGESSRAESSAPLSPAPLMSASTSVASASSSGSDSGSFSPGDYIYNFEHPVHPAIPESCSVTFGSVHYFLEATIGRAGAFKPNLTAKLPVNIVRTPSVMSLEENEPIVITRDWEDQLRYEIVVGGKSVVLDSYLPLAFRFVPLWGKVQLHRIRVYITENLEYYCSNKKVHRLEPQKKYLLLEHKASKGRSLLGKNPQDPGPLAPGDDEILARELEFQLYVPSKFPNKPGQALHPDTSFDNIQVHHWIKICLRISRSDPTRDEKRKHYEISIDSPIHILSPLAAHGNTLLPAYDNGTVPAPPASLPQYCPTPPMSPGVVPVESSSSAFRSSTASAVRSLFDRHQQGSSSGDSANSTAPYEFMHINSSFNNDEPIERDADMHLEANLYKPDAQSVDPALHMSQAQPAFSPLQTPIQRPIHLLRKPSMNPPPFMADQPPPAIDVPAGLPPAYEERDPSLSPLRIDESHSQDVPRVRSSATITATLAGANGNAAAPVAPEVSGLKDMLRASMAHDKHSRLEHRLSAEESTSSPEPRRSSGGTERSQISDPSTNPTTHNSLDEERPKDTSAPLAAPPLTLSADGDIANSPSSPIHSPRGMAALSPIRRHMSRRSSMSSISSDLEVPPEQTVPLLTLSQSSLGATLHPNISSHTAGGLSGLGQFEKANTSVGSLPDWEMRQPRPPYEPMSTIMDLGEVPVDMKLMQLRNPRRHHASDNHAPKQKAYATPNSVPTSSSPTPSADDPVAT
ncbi:hypothetical protein DIURU_004220 [Diutina rugosa]|uniref:Arrestin C-terminal-like domain-containing protein n=1 Tax=Diutina rugosa TaxID=5481 RepID=A0A642UID3_DIURU|nr:uncharacterized protein DIURU_004220 [Diutina rugosa]KAA8899553.1 hypothetical protein DIURU_004220 [Diutina rugosa]